MMKAKVFVNGRSQAVRLPKECRFDESEVLVNKIGDIVLLMPQQGKWDGLKRGLELFTDDIFEDGREEPDVQEREAL